MDKYIYIGLQEGCISAACANIPPETVDLADYFLALAAEGGFTPPNEEGQRQARVMANAMALQLLARSQEAIEKRKENLRRSLAYSQFSDDG